MTKSDQDEQQQDVVLDEGSLQKIQEFKQKQAESLCALFDGDLKAKFDEEAKDPIEFIQENQEEIENWRFKKSLTQQMRGSVFGSPFKDLDQAAEEFYRELHSTGFKNIEAKEGKLEVALAGGNKVEFQEAIQQFEGFKVRNVSLPTELKDPKGHPTGPLDISLAVLDKNGNRIPASKAVYFTAHYDDSGKLVEMTMPQPIKFLSNAPDSPIIIKHKGEEYTLPINRKQYDEMQQALGRPTSIGAPDLISLRKEQQQQDTFTHETIPQSTTPSLKIKIQQSNTLS
jgi:hypothetical protein